jgi:Fe-S-cluster-containing dehydrogenase component
MPRNGLLIEYDYCTGCHACEVACKQEHNYSGGMCGIRVDEVVTVGNDRDDVNVSFMPITTRFCDLCAERTSRGETTACVKHCQAICLHYGAVTDLAKAMAEKPRTAIFAPL